MAGVANGVSKKTYNNAVALTNIISLLVMLFVIGTQMENGAQNLGVEKIINSGLNSKQTFLVLQ